MAAFDCIKSPGGPGSFGGSSRRLARLPNGRTSLQFPKDSGSPGPVSYVREDVLNFNQSFLSGVSRLRANSHGQYPSSTCSRTCPPY